MKKRNKLLLLSLMVSGLFLAGCGSAKEAKLDKIGLEAAKEVALKEAGIADERIVFTSSELDSKNDKEYYDIDFIADGHKYEYDIDALTGIVIESKKPEVKEAKDQIVQMQQHEAIEEQEKTMKPVMDEAASKDKAKGQNEEGGVEIEIQDSPSSSFTEQQAKDLALAQVPGATVNDIRGFEVDYDDGRIAYEGTIIFGEMEYGFEIDGYSGAIREWDVESVYD